MEHGLSGQLWNLRVRGMDGNQWSTTSFSQYWAYVVGQCCRNNGASRSCSMCKYMYDIFNQYFPCVALVTVNPVHVYFDDVGQSLSQHW